jgi:hypothetical protein
MRIQAGPKVTRESTSKTLSLVSSDSCATLYGDGVGDVDVTETKVYVAMPEDINNVLVPRN